MLEAMLYRVDYPYKEIHSIGLSPKIIAEFQSEDMTSLTFVFNSDEARWCGNASSRSIAITETSVTVVLRSKATSAEITGRYLVQDVATINGRESIGKQRKGGWQRKEEGSEGQWRVEQTTPQDKADDYASLARKVCYEVRIRSDFFRWYYYAAVHGRVRNVSCLLAL